METGQLNFSGQSIPSHHWAKSHMMKTRSRDWHNVKHPQQEKCQHKLSLLNTLLFPKLVNLYHFLMFLTIGEINVMLELFFWKARYV